VRGSAVSLHVSVHQPQGSPPRVVLLLYVVLLSTDVALLGRYAVGELSASPMLDHIMLRPNGSPAGTAGNGHSLLIYLSL